MAQAQSATSTQAPATSTVGSRQQSWGRASTVSAEYVRWQEEHGMDWRDMQEASK